MKKSFAQNKLILVIFLMVFFLIPPVSILALSLENYIETKIEVQDSLTIWKYEKIKEKLYDLSVDFENNNQSENNFLNISDLDISNDEIKLNHYGDNAPDTSEIDWHDLVCTVSSTGGGIYIPGTPNDGTLISDNFQDGNGNAPFDLQVRNTTGIPTPWEAVINNVPYATIPGISTGNYNLTTINNGDGTYTHIFTGTNNLGPYQSIQITGNLPIPAGTGSGLLLYISHGTTSGGSSSSSNTGIGNTAVIEDYSTPYEWRYRKCFEVDNTNSFDDLNQYQVYLDIDTEDLINQNKLKADASDLRFVDDDNNILDYYIADDLNTDSTRIWLQIQDQSNDNEIVCMYYGYVGDTNTCTPEDIGNVWEDIFTYTNPQTLYYPVHDRADTNNTVISSYSDNNNITFNNFSGVLNEYQNTTTGVNNNYEPYEVTGPIDAQFYTDNSDSAVPIAYAGTHFVYYAVRGIDSFSFLAPFSNANVEIEEWNGTNWIAACNGSSFTVNTNSTLDLVCDISDSRPYRVTSDRPVLATHKNTVNYDSYVLYPSEKTLQNASGKYETWGVGSNSIRVAVDPTSIGKDNCTVDYYRTYDNGTTFTNSFNLNAANNYVWVENGSSSQGRSAAYHIVSECPLGANSVADSDGVEQTTHLPQQEFFNEYILSLPAQYISVVTKDANVECSIYDENDNLIETDTSSGATN